MLQNKFFILLAAAVGYTNYVTSHAIAVNKLVQYPVNETTVNQEMCTVEVIIANRVYKRNRLMISKQIYAAKFDHNDNLFVIYDNAYGNFDDLEDVQISVLWNGNKYAAYNLDIEPKAYPESIAIDKTGRVLVATNQGLYTFNKQTNKIIPYMLPKVNLIDVAVAPDNTIFVVENRSRNVFKVKGGKMIPITNRTSEFNIYIDTEYNIYFDNGRNTYLTKDKNFFKVEGTMAFTDIAVDAENRVYAVNELGLWTSKKGLLNIRKVKYVGTPASSVSTDSKGNVLIGEEESLLLLEYLGSEKELRNKCGSLFKITPCLFCDIFYE